MSIKLSLSPVHWPIGTLLEVIPQLYSSSAARPHLFVVHTSLLSSRRCLLLPCSCPARPATITAVQELSWCFSDARDDPRVGVIVLTGAAAAACCVGRGAVLCVGQCVAWAWRRGGWGCKRRLVRGSACWARELCMDWQRAVCLVCMLCAMRCNKCPLPA